MKKSTIFKHVSQIACPLIATALCILIYNIPDSFNNALFAISLGSITCLLYYFYTALYHPRGSEVILKIFSLLAVLIFANRLYDYQRLSSLFPMLKGLDTSVFLLIFLGAFLLLLIMIRIICHLFQSKDTYTLENDANNANDMDDISNNSAHHFQKKTEQQFPYFSVFIGFVITIFIITGIYTFIRLNMDIASSTFSFENIVLLMFKYVGSIIIALIAIHYIILITIEMLRLIVYRIKTFSFFNKTGQNSPVFLYSLSVLITLIISYVTYKSTDFNLDSFYDITNSGRYLAVPLSFLFITCIFFIFVQLIHAVLILLINMKIETIKAFWQKANAKTNISERILTILQMLIDIILDTLISILQFAAFIPGYVHTLHEFLFPSSEETNDTEINEHQQ